MHVKYGGFDQNSSSESDKKFLNFGYNSKIELTKIRWESCEKKRVAKFWPKQLSAFTLMWDIAN